MAGSLMAPMVATGLDTCCLISAARWTFTPWGGEHGGVGVEKAELVGASGDVDQVHQILQPLGDAAALRQVIAPLEELGAAHPQLNREAGVHLGADDA